MAKKIALGKGMASLLNGVEPQVIENTLKKTVVEEKLDKQPAKETGPMGPLMVDVEQISTNKNQPRKIFKEKELEELANSIKENGIVQPLIVSEITGGYELIAGERRLRAAKSVGMEQVPVVVKHGTTKDKMVMSVIENIQRSDLNCVEEALAYFDLMDNFKLTQEELAKKLGKERSTVANFLRLLKLPREVVDLLQRERLSFGHGKVLASIKEREKCLRLAQEAIDRELSVRELEKLSKRKTRIADDTKKNLFSDAMLDGCKNKLEQQTGFHFQLKSKKNGSGQVVIKFGNEAEFNDIYEFLLQQ
jgi:ParB family chromosome partitioning protein